MIFHQVVFFCRLDWAEYCKPASEQRASFDIALFTHSFPIFKKAAYCSVVKTLAPPGWVYGVFIGQFFSAEKLMLLWIIQPFKEGWFINRREEIGLAELVTAWASLVSGYPIHCF
jgi:hypothetical protein